MFQHHAWSVWLRGLLPLVAGLTLGLLLVPIAAGAAATPPPADAQALLQKAAKTMSGMQSFHFALSNENGKTPLMEGIDIDSAEGDVVVPDKYQAMITADLKGISLSVTIVGVGNNVWITNPMSGQFQKLSTGMAPIASLFNPYAILSDATKTLLHPKITGSEKIDGVETTKVQGSFTYFGFGQSASSSTPNPEHGHAASGTATGLTPLTITLWIDSQGRVHRLQLDGPLLPTDPSDVVRTFNITNFNKPVKITPPPSGSGS